MFGFLICWVVVSRVDERGERASPRAPRPETNRKGCLNRQGSAQRPGLWVMVQRCKLLWPCCSLAHTHDVIRYITNSLILRFSDCRCHSAEMSLIRRAIRIVSVGAWWRKDQAAVGYLSVLRRKYLHSCCSPAVTIRPFYGKQPTCT